MVVLIPISVFRVQFEVASGRPYSVLEQLIMQSIGDGSVTLDDLCDTFHVHRRLIIEAIITLMHAGWIGLDTSPGAETNQYILTKAGRALVDLRVDKTSILPNAITIRQNAISVVMERVQGQIARNSEVNWFQRSKIQHLFRQAVVLPKGYIRNSCAPSLLDSILPRQPGEWIRHISDPYLTRFAQDYAVVNVDPTSGTIVGLPVSWQPMLRDILLEKVTEASESGRKMRSLVDEEGLWPYLAAREGSRNGDDLKERKFVVDKGDIEFVVGKEKHNSCLVDFLQNARSYVVVVSGAVDAEALSEAKSALIGCANRGVVVSVLWNVENYGKTEEVALAANEIVQSISSSSLDEKVRGQVLMNSVPSKSNVCVVLGDYNGKATAIVGGHRWFWAGLPENDPSAVSVKVTAPGVVRSVALAISDLLADEQYFVDSVEPIRLRKVAASLAQASVELSESISLSKREQEPKDLSEGGGIVADVLLDRHNLISLQGAIAGARSEVRLALGVTNRSEVEKMVSALGSVLRGSSVQLNVEISDELGSRDEKLPSVAIDPDTVGNVRLVRSAKNGAGYFVRDSDLVMVSSYWGNVERREQESTPVADIGLQIAGSEMVSAFRNAIRDALD